MACSPGRALRHPRGRPRRSCPSATSRRAAGAAAPAPSSPPACRATRRRPRKPRRSEEPEVSDEEAREAVASYVAARAALREPEQAKRQALDTLKAWMRPQGSAKTELGNHTVSLVRSTRYAVDHKKLNALLDPRGAGGDRHGADFRVGPHQLSPDASARKRQHGAASFRGGGPAVVYDPGCGSPRYPHQRSQPPPPRGDFERCRERLIESNCWAASGPTPRCATARAAPPSPPCGWRPTAAARTARRRPTGTPSSAGASRPRRWPST